MLLKKIVFFTLLIPLLLSFKTQGNGFGDCCQPPCLDRCSDWTVYGEYLYWRARRCDLDYAIPYDGTNYIGDVDNVQLGYDSGFRIGVLKQWCKFFLDAHYTYFRNNEKSSVTNLNGNLAGTHVLDDVGGVSQGNIEFAQGKWDLDYNVLDLLAGYKVKNTQCLQAYLFGGLKFAFIDQELESFYSENAAITGNAVRVKEKIDMDGYGIDLGIGAIYTVCNCFDFFGLFSYDILLSDFDRRFIYDTSTNGGSTYTRPVNLDDDCWRMVSVINLTFGLAYDLPFFKCWCSDVSIAFGYEFHQWINLPDFLELQSESGEITFDRHLQSLGFDGLFIRLAVGF